MVIDFSLCGSDPSRQHREVQSLAFVSAKKQVAVRDALGKQLVCVLWEEGGVRSMYRHISLIAMGGDGSSSSSGSGGE